MSHTGSNYQQVIALPPEMELRVRRPDGRADAQRVRDGLSVGRAAASDLVIDQPYVNLIHARVVTGIGGAWELKCVGGARLTLADGTTTDRALLTPGTDLGVGDAIVSCVEVHTTDHSDDAPADPVPPPIPASHTPSTQSPGDPSAPVDMPRLVACPTCHADMTAVPAVARFCPKCGVQLPPRDAAGFLIPPEESSPLYPVYKSLRDELQSKLADEAPQQATSLIILAYANALLNLGWRYEHGRGLWRNVEEAARCYAKAGKLSEAWAKNR
jgi:hypothetical protein